MARFSCLPQLFSFFLPYEMELSRGEPLNCELSIHLVGGASQRLANRQLASVEKMKALRLMAGFSWDKKAMMTGFSHGASEIR